MFRELIKSIIATKDFHNSMKLLGAVKKKTKTYPARISEKQMAMLFWCAVAGIDDERELQKHYCPYGSKACKEMRT